MSRHPSSFFLTGPSLIHIYIQFPEPNTKLKHSDRQHPDEAEYFDHLLGIHERFDAQI